MSLLSHGFLIADSSSRDAALQSLSTEIKSCDPYRDDGTQQGMQQQTGRDMEEIVSDVQSKSHTVARSRGRITSGMLSCSQH